MITLYKRLSALLCVLLLPPMLLSLACSCEDDGSKPKPKGNDGVIYARPTILRTIPHNTTSFTQGLLYADSLLYESTGKQFHSKLREIDPKTGVVLRSIDILDPPTRPFFCEGLALKDSQLVQLTWADGKALVYTYPGMVRIRTLSYDGQGWGLTNDDTQFYMTNGSDTLYFRDDNFNVTRKVGVSLEGTQWFNLNELEYVDGKVWANKWYDTSIYLIDPASGQITKVIDCAELDSLVQPHTSESVLNGIAYNSDTGTYFLTGKNWPLIFEVSIP
jgi:glutamine cyclotransferase